MKYDVLKRHPKAPTRNKYVTASLHEGRTFDPKACDVDEATVKALVQDGYIRPASGAAPPATKAAGQ